MAVSEPTIIASAGLSELVIHQANFRACCGNYIWDVDSITITSQDLSAVSSQYGPGPVIGWILVALSVMISRIFAKRNAAQSRFSADYLTTIMFPIIAMGDITLQLYRYPSSVSEITSTNDATLQKKIHAIEAPLAFTELMMIVSVFLALTAMHWNSKSEGLMLWAINLYGLGLETYLLAYGQMYGDTVPHKNFSRSFMANSVPQVIFAWILLTVPLLHTMEDYFSQYLRRYPPTMQNGTEQQTQVAGGPINRPVGIRNGSRKFLHRFAAICLSAVLWVVLASMAGNAIIVLSSQLDAKVQLGSRKAIKDALNVFFHELMPCTSNSILDLDQMAPVVGGACLLFLNIWRLVKQRLQEPVVL